MIHKIVAGVGKSTLAKLKASKVRKTASVKIGSAQPQSQSKNQKPAGQVHRSKAETGYTFLTMDQADRVVNPTLFKVKAMMRSDHQPYLAGSLNRLRLWLLRMERGNWHDARTPLFSRMPYSKIASMFMGIVHKGVTRARKSYSRVPRFPETLEEVELHQSDKIGARGVFPPAHEWVDAKVQEIWTDKPPKPTLHKEALFKSLEWLSKLVPAGSIHVDRDSIMEGFKTVQTPNEDSSSLNVDTNSCYPTYVRKWFHRVWDKSVSPLQRAVQQLLLIQAKFVWKRCFEARSYKDLLRYFHFVATASQRTNVASGYKPTKDNTYKGRIMSKLRVVCAMPKLDTLCGKPILNRLIEVCKQIRNPDGTRIFVALTTPEQIDKNLQVCLQNAAKHRLAVLSTDFSGYDATVPPWLAWEVAKAVSKWMDQRTANIFLALIYGAFYQTRCITTTRIFAEAPSSMKSGSWMTNIMDSLINLVTQRYGYEAGYYKSILNQFVQGDDAILLGVGCDPDTFETVVSQLGFVGNASKQYYEKDSLSFCQKIHVLGYPGGIYPICRAVAATLSLEDDVGIETDAAGQFPYVLAFRTICRLGAACFNPNFKELVQAYKAEDKIKLGADMPAERLAKLAGSYATKYQREALDKPWKSPGTRNGGFARQPVNRVLRGDIPPPPGLDLFKWVYGVDYNQVEL